MKDYLLSGSLLLMLSVSASPLLAQYEPINLMNPSFEGPPAAGTPPPGWIDCGFQGESPPDTHSGVDSFFRVSTSPQKGRTYLGMVVRDNETWEAVATELPRALEPGTCYTFNLYLSRSADYISPTKRGGPTYHTTPAVFRIWGGNSVCDKAEILGSTSVITHTRWVRYQFTFEPKTKVKWFILEAFYQTPVIFPYNGNILVDNASVIRPVPCNSVQREEEEEEVAATPPPPPKPKPAPTPRVEEKKEAPKLAGLSRAQLKTGQVISVDKIYFQIDSAGINPNSFPTLDGIYDFLSAHADVAVEIGGHTNGNCDHPYCDQLSEARAKAVSEYLVAKGIPAQRVRHKGYGKRKPVASNSSADGRRKNQRVEITILEIAPN
jgi:outer membrane protein OmpA-like peptidoglycan-associated protein